MNTYTLLNVPKSRNLVSIVLNNKTILVSNITRPVARDIITGFILSDRHKPEAYEINTQLKASGI